MPYWAGYQHLLSIWEFATKIDSMADEIYRYMNFDRVIEFQQRAEEGGRIAAVQIDEVA